MLGPYARFLRSYGHAIRRHHVELTAVGGVAAAVTPGAAAAMYLAEGGSPMFPTFWSTVYWSAQTVTTVGYGDIVPATIPGQVSALITSILGSGFFVLTAGILAILFVEVMREIQTSG